MRDVGSTIVRQRKKRWSKHGTSHMHVWVCQPRQSQLPTAPRRNIRGISSSGLPAKASQLGKSIRMYCTHTHLRHTRLEDTICVTITRFWHTVSQVVGTTIKRGTSHESRVTRLPAVPLQHERPSTSHERPHLQRQLPLHRRHTHPMCAHSTAPSTQIVAMTQKPRAAQHMPAQWTSETPCDCKPHAFAATPPSPTATNQ